MFQNSPFDSNLDIINVRYDKHGVKFWILYVLRTYWSVFVRRKLLQGLLSTGLRSRTQVSNLNVRIKCIWNLKGF